MSEESTGNAVLNTVVAAGAKAIKDYLAMTGDGGVGDVPESWLQSEIARTLAAEQKHYVFLEHRMTDIVANSGRGSPMIFEGDPIKGRIDIALYERTRKPSDASLTTIIEIKKIGKNSDWGNRDALRMLGINQVWKHKLCGIVSGLFTCMSEAEAQSLFEGTEKCLSQVVKGRHIKLTHSGKGCRWKSLIFWREGSFRASA